MSVTGHRTDVSSLPLEALSRLPVGKTFDFNGAPRGDTRIYLFSAAENFQHLTEVHAYLLLVALVPRELPCVFTVAGGRTFTAVP